jgi:hypothetical protein
MKASKWMVSDVLDDGHNGIIRVDDSGIVLGAASTLSEEQARKICDVHNWELLNIKCPANHE